MKDARIEKLADLIVNYSIEAQPRQKILIHGELGAEPLMAAVRRKCFQAGAVPFVIINTHDYFESIYQYADPEIYADILAPLKYFVETYDARVRIRGELNTKAASNVNPELVSKFFGNYGEITQTMLKREAKGELKWVVALCPTNAYAMDANMSLTEYEDFVFNAYMPDMDDPVGYWKGVYARQQKAVKWLKGKKNVHITAPGTDLTLSIAGRPFVNCACEANVPDGEIFTSPVENSANGFVHFTYPTMFEGFEVDDVRLEFKDGKVVKATAGKNQDFLLRKLDTDPGARFLGEFAIGTNDGISQFTGQILFDEKIGGSFHMALGQSYPESKGENQSAIHWDMICDLRNGGTITVDGELFYKNGTFMIEM